MNTKRSTVRKPVLDGDLALAFAEDKDVPLPKADKPGRPASKPDESRSGKIPDGDVRLTVNVRQDLHLRLKVEAAHRRTTIGEILEELIEAHIGSNGSR